MAPPSSLTRTKVHAAGFPHAPARRWLAVLFLLAAPSVALIAGCSAQTRHRALSLLFEDVPDPGTRVEPKPVVNKPRRPPSPVPAPVAASTESTLPAPEPERAAPRDWRAFQQRMPKDAAGGVDWVRALEQKLITPKPGIDPEAKDQPVFNLDVERIPQGQPLFKVVFPHKAHTERLACANCHPVIFQMQRGATPISMAKIFAGEYCGRCHGKVAFAVPTGCARCHAALAGPR